MDIRVTQNFLHSSKLVSDLLDRTTVSNNDTVLEIGPGKGIITRELAMRCKKLIAVEYDARFVDSLQRSFEGCSNVKIVKSDILKINIRIGHDYKIFSNIPFNITADIMEKFLSDKELSEAYFIMQYEAFLKYAGQPYYNNSYKSILLKPFFDTEMLYRFKQSDFVPVPQASIVLAWFVRKKYADIASDSENIYNDFVSYIYLQGGRTIEEKIIRIFTYNQLKHIWGQLDAKKDDFISSMSYQDWLVLYKTFERFVAEDKKGFVRGQYLYLKHEQSKLQKIHRNRKA